MAERRLARLLRGPGRALATDAPTDGQHPDGQQFDAQQFNAQPWAAAFRAMFEATADGHALLDAKGRILLANPALARMAGAAVPVTPGSPVERLVVPPAREALLAHLAAARTASVPAVHAAPADPGAPPDAEWALQARPIAMGDTTLLLLAVTDRTEQHRAGERLAASAHLETVGRLAGGVAHDFNNLLAAILGATGAARDAGLNPDAATELAQIEDAARRGAALVRQLLAFARRQPMQPRIIDLRRAVEDAAPLLRRLMGRGIAVELAMEAETAPVLVDPSQFDQVLMNLAANAKEAMPQGGRLRITLGRAMVLRGEGPASLPPGRYAVLDIADTGRGIPAEILPRLFEPFFTTRPERGGTGLGLATVQGIVAQCGGQIGVHSTPGEGTRFRIHLPRVAGVPQVVATPAVPAVPVLAPAGVHAGMVLLVEDEAPLRRLSARVLERAGYQVTVADSAEAALDLLDADASAPLALVSDVAMPGIDGLTLARRLRARWPGLPVLLLSGYAEAVLDEDLAGAGMGFLAKPFAPGELVAQLAAVLEGSVMPEVVAP